MKFSALRCPLKVSVATTLYFRNLENILEMDVEITREKISNFDALWYNNLSEFRLFVGASKDTHIYHQFSYLYNFISVRLIVTATMYEFPKSH